MERFPKHSLIKRLHSELPHGAPFDVGTLANLGVSAKHASQYAESDWLVRLARGVYAFPGDDFRRHDCIRFFQNRVAGLHVAGKSALALHGVRHNLNARERLVLWGDDRFVLPEWFTSRYPARYSSSRLFDWKERTLAAKTLGTPPGVTEGLRVSVPERAMLELFSEVGTHEGLEEARNVFDGLRHPRLEVLGRLLECCTSVKTVRLFLTWARETGVVDPGELEGKYLLPTGSSRRWMKRLKDGTLLTLKPHG